MNCSPAEPWFAFSRASFLLLAILGSQHSVAAGSLKGTVDHIWTDADVGNDEVWSALISEELREFAAAPGDMRNICTTLSGNEPLRSWPTDMNFSCQQEHVSFQWTVVIPSALEFDAALKRLSAEMKAKGYTVPTGLDSQTLFPESRIFRGPDGNRNRAVFQRVIDGTTITVIAESRPFTGSKRLISGLNLEWYVTRRYAEAHPEFREALAVLPGNFRADYLDDGFYRKFGDRKISKCFAHHNGVGATFVDDVGGIIVKHLEDNGFRFSNEFEPRNGRTSKAWNRFTDSTYAYIDKTADMKETGFRCHAPQHKGPPRSGQPLPTHPSLKLPISKRPVRTLSELSFANNRLKNVANYFDGLAQRTAKQTWQIQKYKDHRYSNSPYYKAFWQTSEAQGSMYLPRSRPFQAISIELKGAHKEEDDVISCVKARGRWVPLTGWAAIVDYAEADSVYGGNDMCWARLGFIEHENQNNPFSDKNVVMLTRPVVSQSVKQDKLRFECKAVLPWDGTPKGKAAYRRRFLKMYESAEVMRDLVIADLKTVREVAIQQIETNQIQGWSHSNGRPMPFDVETNLPSDETKRTLLDAVTEFTTTRIDAVRRDHSKIYQAMVKALPLSPEKLSE